MSQLALSLEAGISTRHLSYLESGRAGPSRDMVLKLADALLLPRTTRNDLLTQAGFAPAFPATRLDETGLAPLDRALNDMLANHAPWPAIVCDRHWNTIRATPSAGLLMDLLRTVPAECDAPNLIALLVDSPNAAQVIINLDDMRWEMLARLRQELLEAGADPILADLETRLRSKLGSRQPPAGRRQALVPLHVRALGTDLQFLTAIAHFGTSEDVVVRDLRIELFFPADAATRE
ncbi:MAG: helix-turn-helix transcriptional regulator, partial [Hyphomonadaceae bacterium]|nr:helix-turn-helix transcriptional regulator [Hyphomonadaceae bacterium]